MSELENRIRAKLGLGPINGQLPSMPIRWDRIGKHYEQCLVRGMNLNQAIDLAMVNLDGSNRHDRLREKTDA